MKKELIILLGSPGSGKKEISDKILGYLGDSAESISWKKIAHENKLSTKNITKKNRKYLFNLVKEAILKSSKSLIILLGFGLHEDEAKEIVAWTTQNNIEIGCVSEINCSLTDLIKRNEHKDPQLIKQEYLMWHRNKRVVKDILHRKAKSFFDINGDTSYTEIAAKLLSNFMTTKKSSRIYSRVAESDLKTDFGIFRLIAFQSKIDYSYHLCLVKGDVKGKSSVLCRLHSSCITGDIFHSMHCDCGRQLNLAMEALSKNDCGVLIYLFQEGRGINIINKIKAYQLQWQGLDTVDANLELGLAEEMRSYEAAADIIEDLDINSIILMTNNPDKHNKLSDLGVPVEGIVYHDAGTNGFDARYLKTKKERMNHDMGLKILTGTTSDAKNLYIEKSLLNRVQYDKIVPISVPSGVSEQPFGKDIERGAKNRAKNAFNHKENNIEQRIGVGLEGGLIDMEDGLYMICISSIYDGYKYHTGKSLPLKLPKDIEVKIKNGKQFGEEIRKYKASQKEKDLIEELVSREKSFLSSLDIAIGKYIKR